MAYTAKCTGTYIGQFTMFDPVEFNKALNEGYTIQEATRLLKGSGIVFGPAFYPFFSYTVDGVNYVRASYRLHEHFGRSAGSAILWMNGRQCTVCYDPENPGDAIVEDKSGKATANDVVPNAPKKSQLKWLLIGVGILAVLRISQLIIHAFMF